MSYFVPSLKPTTSSQAFNTVMTSLSPKTLCREHVIHNHPYGVNFNDSVCCLSHPMGTQRLIYFLSRVGFTFATDLSIFTRTKVYAKIPKSSTSIIHLCKGAIFVEMIISNTTIFVPFVVNCLFCEWFCCGYIYCIRHTIEQNNSTMSYNQRCMM